jgi:hypothetical protein
MLNVSSSAQDIIRACLARANPDIRLVASAADVEPREPEFTPSDEEGAAIDRLWRALDTLRRVAQEAQQHGRALGAEDAATLRGELAKHVSDAGRALERARRVGIRIAVRASDCQEGAEPAFAELTIERNSNVGSGTSGLADFRTSPGRGA